MCCGGLQADKPNPFLKRKIHPPNGRCIFLVAEEGFALACGRGGGGSDSPPGCHSLSLARLRLRLAYPLRVCNFAVLRSKIAAVCGKAKFHIEPRGGSIWKADTRRFLICIIVRFYITHCDSIIFSSSRAATLSGCSLRFIRTILRSGILSSRSRT